jgi:hypothetical protein
VSSTIENFQFGEESEHNLKYYCIDALDNKGPVDEEKFKVEGTAFEIQLNKKWNLISVPFVMLNSDPEVVFNDIKDNVSSVWTYDPLHEFCSSGDSSWCVWTPNPAPDNLKIQPGWGYWVLAKNDTKLIIGGSLFSPAITPPDKKVVKGWNLIGYYGTDDGQTGYYGPYGYGNYAYCALHSLVDTTVGYPRWSSLVTYWEPDNPDQWKYLSEWDNMDPGAGYWLEIDVDDTYTFSTTCGGY